MRFNLKLTSLSLILSCVCIGVAPAQDFYSGGVSAHTAANAGIYVPSASDASDALALNPAGLTALSGPTLNISTVGLFARGTFSNSTNANSPMQANNGLMPFGAFGTPIGHSRWSIAAGFTPDLLSSSKWSYRDSPGTAGVSYGLQSEKSAILAFRSSAGVGFALSPNISLGAALGVVYNSNTLDAPYIFQNQPVLQGLKTLLDLHTTGVGVDTSFGVRAKLSRTISFGVAYKTKTNITSTGNATGNLNALFNTLGVTADPAFAYRAQVKVILPQSALANLAWQANPQLRFNLQGDWTDWYNSFHQLPVSLTQGTNVVVNSLLQSTSLNDTVPLDWKQQFTARASAERTFGETFSVSGGFLHGNNPVPSSTLSPLTAAIMQNGISAGFGYTHDHFRLDLSYGFDFTASENVGTSALLAGEYSHSKVGIGTQALTLSTAFHL